MTNTSELKPCPFCGGEAEFHFVHGGDCYIKCRLCCARTSYGDKETVIDGWNRRVME